MSEIKVEPVNSTASSNEPVQPTAPEAACAACEVRDASGSDYGRRHTCDWPGKTLRQLHAEMATINFHGMQTWADELDAALSKLLSREDCGCVVHSNGDICFPCERHVYPCG